LGSLRLWKVIRHEKCQFSTTSRLTGPSVPFNWPVDKTLGRSGRPFVQLVLEALDMNRITAVQASHYLDLRFEHFDKLRDELRMAPMRPADKFDDGE